MPRTVRYQGAIVRNHHILLIRLNDYLAGQSFWAIPGGGREPAESEEACVQREMFEETALSVTVVRLLLDEEGVPEGEYRRLKTYLCRCDEGEARAGYEPEVDPRHAEISGVGWFDLRSPQDWGDDIKDDSITFPLLQRIQVALGYPVVS